MSSLIHRLASAAARPQSRLQPMLGSIFAPANHPIARSPAAAAPFATEGFSTARSYADPVQDAGSLASRLRNPAPDLFAQDAAPMRPNLLPARSPIFDLQPPAEHTTSHRRDTGSAEAASQQVNRAAVSAEEPKRSPQQSSASVLHPIVQTGQTAAPRIFSREPSAIHAGRSDAPRRAAAGTPHRPDEIHIHIGRIEVAAISQTAPRPAPAPRRSVNLDDYLRGSGRGRAG